MGAPTYLFALLLFILFINTTTATSSSSQTYKTYVKTACNSTTYPQMCYKSLSSYATSIKSNPQKLCSYALSVTLKAAKTSASKVSKLAKKKGITKAEASVVEACIETIKDSVDELKQSVTAMKNLGGADMQYQLDNIKTWVSASLTDEDTCTDGFDEQKPPLQNHDSLTPISLELATQPRTYPQICYKSLSSYASTINSNPQKLCSYALSVTLNAARDASSAVTKLSKKKELSHSETLVVKDCMENIRDSIDELKQSVSAMSNLGGANMEYRMDDIKTWVSAALPEDDTCTDGFDEVKVSLDVKNAISKIIVNIARRWLVTPCLSSTASIISTT
ncbi:hypothetical protein ACLB2K_075033 [Fragaria x ananassa]